LNNWTRSALIVVMSLVWAMNFTAPIFVKDYQPSSELNVGFLGVITALVTTWKRGGGNGDGDGSGNQDDDPTRDGERRAVDR
jgi:hypothetical protein